ncbi:MAG: exodeoxyribonuclease VII small subunit [Xenococcaceae cyanobacterium]
MSNSFEHTDSFNYEETVAEIEQIIRQVESGSLPLEEVFEQFAIAVEHLHQCETFLTQGKQRMNLLIETLEEELEF